MSTRDAFPTTPSRTAHTEAPESFPDGVWTTGTTQRRHRQGLVSVTPLQLRERHSAFANGGNLWSPTSRGDRCERPAGNRSTEGAAGRGAAPEATISLPPIVRDPDLLASFASRRRRCGQRRSGPPTSVAGFPLDHFMVAGKTGTAMDNTQLAENDTSGVVAFGPFRTRSTRCCASWRNRASAPTPPRRSCAACSKGSLRWASTRLDPLHPADPVGAQPSDVTTRLSHTETLPNDQPLRTTDGPPHLLPRW